MKSISVVHSRCILVSSGHAEGPVEPLRRFLLLQGAERVKTVAHPLLPEEMPEHRITEWVQGRPPTATVRRFWNRPPLTYLADQIIPIRLGKADIWVGFNCLATAQGLVRRRFGRVKHVVHWNVDFVPNRFGKSFLTTVYEFIDSWCCRRATGRVELSIAALNGRAAAYRNIGNTPVAVIPMGTWLDESPVVSAANLASPRVVFLGHLVERMGAAIFVDVLAELRDRGVQVDADIIGGGPLLDEIRAAVRACGLSDRVVVHGFVGDFENVRQILAAACVGVAPYEESKDSFSRFADPGKLKAYLGVGLPILLTAVPPNAAELASLGGAEVIAGTPGAFADAIERLLTDRAEWADRHQRACAYARRFDWSTVFSELRTVGLILERPDEN
jgi:glycosyltransferase involved in cell wall biosynthesis